MPDRTCSIDGCARDVRSRGLCNSHYQSYYRKATRKASLDWLIKRPCAIAGCRHQAFKQGWCLHHHGNWRLTGDPTRRPANGFVTAAGYLILTGWAGHPLADKQGRVFEHRLVLWDKLGPGEHPCHWCGKMVSWDKSYPADEDALVTDHLDFNRLNNKPGNLIPSDAVCNIVRYQRPVFKVRNPPVPRKKRTPLAFQLDATGKYREV